MNSTDQSSDVGRPSEIADQIDELRSPRSCAGERRDVYGRMRIIAANLTPGEIDGLAAYYRAGFR